MTGSKAFERFSGPQIANIFRCRPEAYANTERISLVSSFACSLFLGRIAPIDLADASGMSLLDIRRKKWHTPCMDAVAPDLREKLGDPVPAATVLGPVSAYMCDRFGFSESCRVVAFTGDNPSSMAGMRMRQGDVGVSLGTSDVVFVWLRDGEQEGGGDVRPSGDGGGCVWVNPMDEEAYMALLWCVV